MADRLTLPPLPRPAPWFGEYSADHMNAQAVEGWKLALNAAEKRIERMKRGENTDYSAGWDDALYDVLTALRSLPVPEAQP